MKPADKAWVAFLASAVVFEFCSDDLLSHSSARLCAGHPVLGPLMILGLAGHLSCVLPAPIDVLNPENRFHRAVAAGYRLLRGMERV